MIWDLPTAVEINGVSHNIRNKCDYRMVLDVIVALNDIDLSYQEKIKCALIIFYEDISKIEDYETATKEMFRIINGGNVEEVQEQKPALMDWEHDFNILVAPINRVLGYEIRGVEYLHWHTLLGAYYEIGECVFSTIVSIRSKKLKGKKLEKWEEEYAREHRKMIELPQKLTAEEEEFLNSDL